MHVNCFLTTLLLHEYFAYKIGSDNQAGHNQTSVINSKGKLSRLFSSAIMSHAYIQY